MYVRDALRYGPKKDGEKKTHKVRGPGAGATAPLW